MNTKPQMTKQESMHWEGLFLAAFRASGLIPVKEPAINYGTTHQEAISHMLRLTGMSATDLATRIGVRKSRVSDLLNQAVGGQQRLSYTPLLQLEELAKDYFLEGMAGYWHTQAVEARERSSRKGGWR